MMDRAAAPDGGPADDAAGGAGPRLALWTSLLLTLAVALPRIVTTSVSIDEAYSMDTAGRSIAGTLHQATHFELQPPLYFLVLNLWLSIHRSPEFARLLSLGFVLLTLVLLYRIGRRLGGDLAPALLPLLAALTAPVAWNAMTARGYGLTLLLLAVCCYGFVGLWCSDRPASRWDLPLFIAGGVAAIYSFYYSGFAVAGLVAAAMVSGRRRRELAIAMTAMVIIVLPLIPEVFAQASAHPTQPEGDTRPPQVGTFLIARSFGLLFWSGQLHHTAGLVLLAVWVVALGSLWASEAPPRWRPRDMLWLVAAILPWLCLLGLEQSGAALVLPRHRVVLLPGMLILLVMILDQIRRPKRRRVAAGLTLLLFALLFASYQRNQEIFDWRAAAGVIASREVAGEPVLVFTSDGLLPLRWIYDGPNRLVALPADPDLERYDPSERYLRDSSVVRQRIESVVGPGQSFWLVRRQWLPPVAGDSLLTQYASRETDQTGEWKVQGIEVLRLRRRTN